jgi:hypothetical protein
MKKNLRLSVFLIVAMGPSCSATKDPRSHLKDDSLPGISFAPCSPDTSVQTICSTSPTAIHPTQFAVGYRDVEKKREKLRKIKDRPDQIDEYLKKKIVPAVKGPDSVYYIVDGHHTSRALAEESILVLYMRVIHDYSNMNIDTFLAKLKSEQLVWLYDENGVGNQDPRSLPAKILALKDDPYRSLAEDAQEEGAFNEEPVYYQQFIWANYFRKVVDKFLLESNYKEAINEAVLWSKHPKASHLPGYKD